MYDFIDIRVIIPEVYKRGLESGVLERHGSVLRYAGNKSVIKWLPTEGIPVQETETIEVKSPSGSMDLQKLSNMSISQMGIQVVSTAMIMRKLGQIQRVVEAIDTKMNEALQKLDTVERNQVLDFTKCFMRGYTALTEDAYEKAADYFREFRSDVRTYFFRQDPVHLLAHYSDFVDPIGKAVAMTAVLESRAHAEMGSPKYHDIAQNSYELLKDMMNYLSIKDTLMSRIPVGEDLRAINNYANSMPAFKKAMPELEASYAVQSLYLDVYCEKKEKAVARLTK